MVYLKLLDLKKYGAFVVDGDHGHHWSVYIRVCEAVLKAAPGDVVDSPGDHVGVPHLLGLLPRC